MEQIINIQKIEAKTTKAGQPMWTLTTDIGKLSVFKNEELVKNLVLGQSYNAEIIENNGYKNLMKINGKAKDNFVPASQIDRDGQIKQKRFDSASFAISYAVRLVEAGKVDIKDLNAKAKELLSLYEEMLDMVAVQKVV